MDPGDLERYKQLLLTKRRELSAARVGAESPALAAGHLPGDFTDQATAATEAEVQVRLRQTDSHLRRAIEDALGRIEQGTFGVCTACKKPVPQVRLDAVPWTRLCRECKEK
jgi:DnaK suppressor protein